MLESTDNFNIIRPNKLFSKRKHLHFVCKLTSMKYQFLTYFDIEIFTALKDLGAYPWRINLGLKLSGGWSFASVDKGAFIRWGLFLGVLHILI